MVMDKKIKDQGSILNVSLFPSSRSSRLSMSEHTAQQVIPGLFSVIYSKGLEF